MPAKQKLKRKRGKKFVFDPKKQALQAANSLGSIVQSNPFEAVSSKKFMKTTQYGDLRKEYNHIGHNSTFQDKRIAQNAQQLTEEEKQKLRYKAQQLLNMKNKKEATTTRGDDNLAFTHKGKVINESNVNDSDEGEREDDYDFDIANQLLHTNTEGMSKKDQHLELIRQAKLQRDEKRKERMDTTDKIRKLDDDFADITANLTKRRRDFEVKNDDYYKNINMYQFADKTKPTDRIKTEEEIEKEKQKKLERLKKKREMEEDSNSDDSSDNNNEEPEVENLKNLTKKERIGKLIEKRLERAEKIRKMKEEKAKSNSNIPILKKSKKHDDEDDMSDLDQNREGNQDNNEDEEDEDEYDEEGEYEDGEDDEEGEYDEDEEGEDDEEGEYDDEEGEDDDDE